MKAVLFDFNGVIVDDEALHEAAFRTALRTEGRSLKSSEYLSHFAGRTDEEGLRSFLSREDIHELLETKRSVYAELLKAQLPVVPEILSFAKQLRDRGSLLAIVSGAPRHEIQQILERVKAEDLFPIIVSASDVAKGKPDPEGYLLAAKLLGIDPKRCTVIEDSPTGIEAAQRAGMKSIAISSTHTIKQLRGATKIVDILR